ncbi:MAG: MXAN_6577-like cysteine-rich protein [Polyangiales bacterium]
MRARWWLATALALTLGCAGGEQPVVEEDSGFVDDTGSDNDVGNPPDTGPTPCGAGQTRCGDVCVDTASNNDNCGSCGNACSAGQTCTAGACASQTDCPAGQTRCGSSCVDTGSDAANCGACGNACPTGDTCTGGTCMTPVSCPSGQTACGTACVDTSADVANCGSCGNACAAGEACSSGVCMASMSCPSGQSLCAGACIDPQTDVANCGGCGTACGAGERCTAGTCMAMGCPSGQTLCGASCVNTGTDTTNCGGCGRACAPGQTCSSGMCTGGMTGCPSGQTMCGAACADTQTDNANCGSCGTVCPAGQVCRAGSCSTDTTCPSGQSMCGSSCVNLQTSATNCGSCGNACPSGRSCSAGSCACASGQTLCGSTCVNTQTDASNCGGCGTACPSGQTCTSGSCGCPSGQTACGSSCVNTQTDRANCGMCGRACASGQTCTAGSCGCPTGQTLCGSSCVDTSTSSAHCGGCNRPCMTGTSCTMGACRGTPPANDTRSGATTISLAQPSQTINADTSAARNDTTGACGCTSGNDVFYRFTLTQPEIVYADTLGSTWDTSLFLQNSAGANVTSPGTGQLTCNDDASLCRVGTTVRYSLIVARLNPGTYYLVLSGCSAGAAAIHFQHLPAGNGAATAINPTSAAQTASGTVSGTGTVTTSCCSGGAENALWWVTCPSAAATTFWASTCGTTTAYDVEIAQYSALRSAAGVCNDDVNVASCGRGSTVTASVPATTANQAGLNTLIVDACSGSGAYQVRYAVNTCPTGRSLCGTCVDTQTDNNNCGGCNRVCGTGTFCRAGSCVTPPSNDTRAGATAISLTNPQVLLSANTTNARNDTTGPTSCTSGNDVFFRFVLTADEIVYADTVGTTWDTSLFLQNSAGTNITAANLTGGQAYDDDGGLAGCNTGLQTQIMARLSAGTYYLVLSGCASGASTVRFQHLPIGSGTLTALAAGTSTPSGTTPTGTGRISASVLLGQHREHLLLAHLPVVHRRRLHRLHLRPRHVGHRARPALGHPHRLHGLGLQRRRRQLLRPPVEPLDHHPRGPGHPHPVHRRLQPGRGAYSITVSRP